MQNNINTDIISEGSITFKPGRVSIIIPVYNAMETLSRCIDSIMNQTYSNYEVIFVDDRSEDQSCDFLYGTCKKDDRFRLIRLDERKGAGAARNVGMAEACGEYLYFFDADDEMLPRLLQKAVSALQETDADMVAFNFYRVFTDGALKEDHGVYTEKLPNGLKCFNYTDCPDRIMNVINPPPWDKLFRRSFVLEKGVKFDELFSTNDVTFSSVLAAMAGKITYLPDLLYRYYVGHANTITSQKAKRIGDMVKAVESACNQVRQLPYFNIIEQSALYFTVQKFLYAFEYSVPNWHAVQAAEYYRNIHKIFNSEWFTGWDREENCPLNGREAQLFYAIRQNDYDTFLSLQDRRLIVSFTSYPARIHCVAPVVRTLLKQSHRADKIVLWLASEQFPGGEADLPDELLSLKQDGSLSIEWCNEDLKPHKKYFYAFQMYSDCLIVTVDDDNYYPEYVLDRLYLSYLRYPNAVSACRTCLIPFESDGTILSYSLWPLATDYLQYQPCMQLMATGVGGILYPPRCFPELMDRKDVFSETCLMGDDMWLKMLELHNGVPVVQAGAKYWLSPIDNSQDSALWHQNLTENQNDKYLRNIIRWYDGCYGDGAFLHLLSDTSRGVPQLGLTAYANHIHRVYNSVSKPKVKPVNSEPRYPAARIDLKNRSEESDCDNTIDFFASSEAMPKIATWANSWQNGQLYYWEIKGRNVHLEFMTNGRGTLRIMLMGIYMPKADGTAFPWWVGYTGLTVNGKSYLDDPVLCWHNQSFIVEIPCENQQLFQLDAKWDPGEEYIGKLISASQNEHPPKKFLSFLKRCISVLMRCMKI